jgi:hypothetical protein
MSSHPNGSNRLQVELSLNEKTRRIYTSDNKNDINRLTELLVDALVEDDDDSRSALRQFFDLPSIPSAEQAGTEIDRVLISQVRLFINGTNANRVQTWLSAYEESSPNSWRRSMLEDILSAFVARNSQTEAIESGFADARTLLAESSLK